MMAHQTEAKLLDMEILQSLATEDGNCVTIFLPAHVGGAGTKPASQRLHVALGALAARAAEAGMHPAESEELFAPLNHLAADPALAAGHRDSFAIFRSLHRTEVLRVPGPPLEGAWLRPRFCITPLLERLALRPDFHLLTLTKRRVRLFKVELDEFSEEALPPGVIGYLDDFTAFDQPDHTLRNRASTGHGGTASFGTGSEREKQSRHFYDFCHALDRGLRTMLTRSELPLVLAGTAPEVAIYREACDYAHVVETAVTLSPDGGWSDAAIVFRAREILAERVPPAVARTIAQFERKSGTGLSVADPAAIREAASGGRVSALILAEGFRAISNGSCGDTISDAVNHTLRHAGSVWIVPRAAAQDLPPLAAILRY